MGYFNFFFEVNRCQTYLKKSPIQKTKQEMSTKTEDTNVEIAEEKQIKRKAEEVICKINDKKQKSEKKIEESHKNEEVKEKIKIKGFRLANDVEIPSIGFGCAFGNWVDKTKFFGFLPERAWGSITTAIKVGYRHFDGAHIYGTERHMGSILGRYFSEGTLKREDVFLTTKLAHPLPGKDFVVDHRLTFDVLQPGLDIQQRINDDLDKSLEKLGVGYVDLLLMHWPGEFNSTDVDINRAKRKEVWETFEELYKVKKARAIGVSNFNQDHLKQLIEDCKVRPMVNQIEIHPYCQQESLVEYCRKEKIRPVAHSPLASGAFGLLQDPVLMSIVEKVNKGRVEKGKEKKNIGQIIIRWLLQKGCVVLPKSNSEQRQRGNLKVFDFNLAPEDMVKIKGLNKNQYVCGKPDSIA